MSERRGNRSGARIGAALGALVVAVGFMTAAACGSATNTDDPCNKLVAKLQAECPDLIMSTSAGELNCTGQAGCAANCALKATCEEIRTSAKSYVDCTNACKTQ